MRLFKIPVHRNSPLLNINKCIYDVIFKRKDYISILENKFIEIFKVNYAISVSSGRKGMQRLLASYNFPVESEIIFPTLTFYILPQIVKDMGYRPIFINCTHDLQMDVKELEQKITPKTKAIIATHFFGKACPIEKILDIAKRYKLKVIEDCAHCPMVKHKNKLLGTWGDAAFFSFQNRKIINGLTGGMVIFNDKQLFYKWKKTVSDNKAKLRTPAFRLLMDVFLRIITNKYIYFWIDMFFASKIHKNKFNSLYQLTHHNRVLKRTEFTKLQARIVLEQLVNMKSINDIRTKIANYYNNALYNTNFANLACTSYNYYAFFIKTTQPKIIHDFLNKKQITTLVGENIVKNCGKYYDAKGNYQKTENVLNNLIELPIYNNLAENDCIFIINELINCIENEKNKN